MIDAVFSFSVLSAIVYFAFEALQGDYGLTRKMEVEAEQARLERDVQHLAETRARLENLTLRLSDDYLDLDLLDQQARDRLGMIRPDEIIIR